jgi:hypothetical protein
MKKSILSLFFISILFLIFILSVNAASSTTSSCVYGTATPTKSVNYGNYKFYATLGSTNSLLVEVRDVNGKYCCMSCVTRNSCGCFVTCPGTSFYCGSCRLPDSSAKSIETLMFIGITSGTAATKTTTKTVPHLDVTVFSMVTRLDGTVVRASLGIGPQGKCVPLTFRLSGIFEPFWELIQSILGLK